MPAKRLRSTAVATILLAASLGLALAPGRASAHDLDGLLREDADLQEVRRLATLHARLHDLIARYEATERRVGRARLRAAEAIRLAELASSEAELARARFDERVRAAYEIGRAGALDALLGAPALGDLATISEFAARAISLDERAVRETIVAEAVLSARRARAEAEEAALAARLEELRTMLTEMERAVEEATALAERARADAELMAAIAAQRQRVADAVSRAGSWDLGVIDYEQDQGHLLAMLGPTGGRTCETPPDLVETGESFSGYASWYGWEFGGQPTATGAIFDPRLFTAANRWLPFGTFLRVRHGDRCAIVLVNDRGPYGRLERVIDLSQAAAEHLGVGVSWVSAEILVPRSVGA